MEDKMDVKKNEPVNEGSPPSSASSTRRKLLQGSPLLLLLANRPAFAVGTCSISGFMSAKVGTSLTTHDGDMCNGWSPGNWKNDNGQITLQAWDKAGVAPEQSFSALFNTVNMPLGGIRIVNNGVVGGFIDYTSVITYSMIDVIKGAVSGGNNASSVVKHAAATYLNAAFLANGGGGLVPDGWMSNYISPTDVVGCYLLYELVHLRNPAPDAGVTYLYERGGSVIAESQNMTSNEFESFFHNLSDAKGSDAWQNG